MPVRWRTCYAGRMHEMPSSAIRELLKVTERPEVISFAGGLPAPEVFPTSEVSRVSSSILRERGAQALQYGPTEGYTPLRELLAGTVACTGAHLTVDNVLITTGSQQAIDLIGRVFLDPGDTVVVESPTYLAALQAWRAYGVHYHGVPADDDGMDVAHLQTVLDHGPKLIYNVPNFHNPTGVSLSVGRRTALVDLADRAGAPVVEDDPYSELRFEGEQLPSLLSLASAAAGSGGAYHGGVISLGTFSKILAPGLRVGWVIAPRDVIAELTRAKQATDLHTASLNQMIAYELLVSGFLTEHTTLIVETYRQRRDAMLAALAAHFPSTAHWTHPHGGMFIWIELPEGIDAGDLLHHSLEERVAFVPGRPFHVDHRGLNTMRLNFSNAAPDQIWQGVERLGRVLQAMLDNRIPQPSVA